MDDTPVASFSLTHVHYNPNDPLSFLSAWLALVPQALCVVYATLIWSSREAEVLLMFAGQMGCEALNFVLKRIIKEERPKQMFGKGYGMPSSHAQFMTYFAIYLGLFLLSRHAANPSSPSALSFCMRSVLAIGISIAAAAVSISRIYLNYHTPRQVLAGCAAGVVCALAWFSITGLLRAHGWIDWILDLELARFFRVRDLVVSEDLTEAGWQRWESKRRLRRRGNGEHLAAKSE
ncbi:phosphatidic acid phosphatase type 2/haloperoxidase [Aspergillus ambiguus]|uniref:phosphatase PAP2 family protein n=1 Tax=Aspergillus ambiguus TaxID=176160 RepID=UPI003CCCC9FC